ncbi:unnamed protein product [Eruca vesicaria subsp. sativa]|uniref:Protein kinase domain-containing protein n=1 Tax=Eruca vesicaria subsp. sativa TaxID=29727 RepID=A0ABC8JM15_ERUVS|nr:unnamed protein product [Eruca vesicaria subsp. sativa]
MLSLILGIDITDASVAAISSIYTNLELLDLIPALQILASGSCEIHVLDTPSKLLDDAVYIVMEFCEGGESFDRIVVREHYTEKADAAVLKTIVEVVQVCHKQGVMDRNLKPENFLFANKKETSALKAIDFGLSVFFKPCERFNEIVGSPYYMAQEVLRRNYGPEIDVLAMESSSICFFVVSLHFGQVSILFDLLVCLFFLQSHPNYSDKTSLRCIFGTKTEEVVAQAIIRYEYRWTDGIPIKKPIVVSVPEYVNYLMDWIETQIDNKTIFPQKPEVSFPPNFKDLVKVILKRLFRVYAHIYHSHFQEILNLKEELHLNTCFKHLVVFISEYQLIDEVELEPLKEIVGKVLKP